MSGLGGTVLTKQKIFHRVSLPALYTELSVFGLPSPSAWFRALPSGLLGQAVKSATGFIRHGFPNELDKFGWKDEA